MQSRIIFEDVLSFLELGDHDLSNKRVWRVANDAQRATVEYRPTGARVRCIGSDPKRAHGLRPVLALLDEPSQWPHHTSEAMRAAMVTSLGKAPGSRMIALGTRPASKLHWFSRMLNGGCDYAQSHTVSKDDMEKRPFQRRVWARANPSLPAMPDLLSRIEKEAQEARHDPALLAAFLALRLNGGVSDIDNRDMLISPALWSRCLEAPDGLPVGDCTWGIDMGSAHAMSAVACCWESGRLEILGMFGSEPSLEERARYDSTGPLYSLALKGGELMISPKRIPDVRTLFREAAKRWGMPRRIICDRWRIDELRDALEDDDLPWRRVRLIPRGQGYRDGSCAVRAWRKAAVTTRIRPVKPSRLLTAQLAEAVTVSDPSANEKLARDAEGGRRKRSRDDCVAAALLAVEFGLPLEDTPARRRAAFRIVG